MDNTPFSTLDSTMSTKEIYYQILAACESNDLPALKYIFEVDSVRHGWNMVQVKNARYQTDCFVIAAIANSNRDMVEYLLSVYNDGDLCDVPGLKSAFLHHPCADLLNIVVRRSPQLLTYNNFPHSPFLHDALEQRITSPGDDLHRLIHAALDLGADPNFNISPLGPGGLYLAMLRDHPFDIVKKLRDKGAILSRYAFHEACRKGNFRAIRLFMGGDIPNEKKLINAVACIHNPTNIAAIKYADKYYGKIKGVRTVKYRR